MAALCHGPVSYTHRTNKPRTTGEGYKGMLHQPSPDKAPDLLGGIIAIRKMHIRVMAE